MTFLRTSLLLAFVLVGATQLLAQDDTPPPAPSATEPVPHLWLQRHRALCEQAKKGDIELLFLGGSITQGWERDGKATWEDFYGDRKAANFGADQDLTGNVLWRLQNGALDGINPKVVVLLVGIDNLVAQNTAEETASGVAAVKTLLRTRLPEAQLLLLGIFPAGARPNPYREKITRCNELIAAMVDDHTEFLDVGLKLMEPDGTISQVVLYNGLHPAQEGYSIWAREMEPTLAKMLGVEPKKLGGALNDPNLGVADDPALTAIARFISDNGVDLKTTERTNLPRPPMVKFNHAMDYFWVIETNHGTIDVKLMPKVAPMHCSSTIYLSTVGFYDDLVFHRVIPAFMAQGGCPLGSGTGGPGYSYRGEFDPRVRHTRGGLLSMANSGPNTDGSQFFLTFVATPGLDNKHTIFGEVVKGMDVVKELEKRGTKSGRTIEKVLLVKSSIRVEPKS